MEKTDLEMKVEQLDVDSSSLQPGTQEWAIAQEAYIKAMELKLKSDKDQQELEIKSRQVDIDDKKLGVLALGILGEFAYTHWRDAKTFMIESAGTLCRSSFSRDIIKPFASRILKFLK